MGRLPTPTLTLVTGGRHMVSLDELSSGLDGDPCCAAPCAF